MSFKCLYSGGDRAGDGGRTEWPWMVLGASLQGLPRFPQFPKVPEMDSTQETLTAPPSPLLHACGTSLYSPPPHHLPHPAPLPPHIKNNRTNYLEGPQELNCFQLLNTNHKSQKVVGFQEKEVPTGVCKAAREQTAVTKTTIKAQTLWPSNTGRPLPFDLKICLNTNFHLFPLPFVLKIL